jgi:glycosyltransferase involved in cell wall biosynthesis
LTNFFPDRSHRLVREVQALVSASHDVLVLSRKEPYPPQEEQYPAIVIAGDRLKIIRCDIPILLKEHFYFTPRLSVIHYFLHIIDAHVRLLRIALWWKADVIHVQELPFSTAALVVAKLMRIPMLLEVRQRYAPAAASNLQHLSKRVVGRAVVFLFVKLLTLAEILMYVCADIVICISDEEKASLARLGIPPQKIAVISHYPDAEEFSSRSVLRSRDSFITIVYAGYLNPLKGVNLLLEAFSYFHRELPEARVLVLGDGPTRTSLEAQARRLSIASKVKFLGWLNPRDAFDLIRASDVAVIPHTGSSLPSKLFSYMHCGKPIVASDFPGVRTVLANAQCGLLFKPGDPNDLAAKLKALLSDKAVRTRLGANAQIAASQRYNWQNESRKLLAIYSNLPTRKACDYPS